MSEDKKYSLDELKNKLTNKERIFCHQYIIDWNGTRSAKIAGYSAKTATETAYENLTKPHIKQYIAFIKDDIEKEAGISKLKQVNEFNKIAYSTISHIHDTWIKLKEFENLTDDQKSAIESIETKTEHKTVNEEVIAMKYVKIKLYSKTTALSELNKMLGYNETTKLSVEVTEKRIGSVTINRPEE